MKSPIKKGDEKKVAKTLIQKFDIDKAIEVAKLVKSQIPISRSGTQRRPLQKSKETEYVGELNPKWKIWHNIQNELIREKQNSCQHHPMDRDVNENSEQFCTICKKITKCAD